MARGSNTGRPSSRLSPNLSQLVYAPVKLSPLVGPLTQITPMEALANDRRVYNPHYNVRPSQSSSRPKRQLKYALSPALRYLQSDPSRKLAVCARRSIRRQVLLALKKGGGASGRSRKRFSAASKVKC